MKKIFPILFLILIAVGVAARFVLLTISFEYDELFTAITANPFVPFSFIWTNYLMVDVHPPLHNMLLWLYNHVVPYGPEWVLRLPSLVFGLVALWEGCFLFPRRFGRMARNIFVLLLSCDFYLILYAQHARAYALIICASIPFTFLYLNLARRISKKRLIAPKQWVLYGALALVLCWSHYFGALLFGLFSCILGVLALKNHNNLKPLVLTVCAVMACFLPWMVPNLMANLSQARFAGNWWGNKPLEWHVIILWMEFFFSSQKVFWILLALLVVALLQRIFLFHAAKKWVFWQELLWVFLPCFCSLVFVLIMSTKIYWLLWRYFIAFIPCLYLFPALFLAPLCRRFKLAQVGVLLLGVFSYWAFSQYVQPLWGGAIFTARGALQVYKEAFADKELFVVAHEAFPPQSMDAMYGFYPHYQWGMKNRVTEVLQLDIKDFEEILRRRKDGLFWMPNCDERKMNFLIQKWNWNIGIFARYENTCFLIFAEDDRRTFDEEMLQDYQQRFSDYARRLQAQRKH